MWQNQPSYSIKILNDYTVTTNKKKINDLKYPTNQREKPLDDRSISDVLNKINHIIRFAQTTAIWSIEN